MAKRRSRKIVQIQWMPSVACTVSLDAHHSICSTQTEIISVTPKRLHHACLVSTIYMSIVLAHTKNVNEKSFGHVDARRHSSHTANGFAHLMLSIHMLDMNNFSGKIFHETKVKCELRIHIHISETANIYQTYVRTSERQRRRWRRWREKKIEISERAYLRIERNLFRKPM